MYILIVGAVGTLLAASGLELWIALTTALAFAFAAYLEYRQTEMTLIKYNQAATDLNNIQAWWAALTPDQQADRKNVDKLVEHTEKVLANEQSGWIQEMRDTLVKLRSEQSGRAQDLNGADKQADLERETPPLIVEVTPAAADGLKPDPG